MSMNKAAIESTDVFQLMMVCRPFDDELLEIYSVAVVSDSIYTISDFRAVVEVISELSFYLE